MVLTIMVMLDAVTNDPVTGLAKISGRDETNRVARNDEPAPPPPAAPASSGSGRRGWGAGFGGSFCLSKKALMSRLVSSPEVVAARWASTGEVASLVTSSSPARFLRAR